MRRETWILYLSMFTMGSCGIAYEYTLSKVASDLLGNSARQWALVIGIMMLFMGLGADFQKRFRDERLFNWFISLEAVLGLLGGLGPLILLHAFSWAPTHYALAQYGLVAVIGALIGLEIPILTRINESFSKELKINLGGVLKMDYLGSFVGSLLWIFALPFFFSITQTALVLGLVNLLVTGGTLIYFRRRVSTPGVMAWGIMISFAILLWAGSYSRRWTLSAEQRLYKDLIVLSETTQYQHITLTESHSGTLKCFINNHLQFSSADEHIYHENLVHPAMSIASRRARILILGGGDGLALREVLKYSEVEEVILCDLDPGMTELASNHPGFTQLNQGSLRDARVTVLENHKLSPLDNLENNKSSESDPDPDSESDLKQNPDQHAVIISSKRPMQYGVEAEVATVDLIHLDASVFVEQFEGTFDVIIADFPDPNNRELAKLYSNGFYELIREKLSREGVFVQQSTSPFYARDAYLCIGKTMRSAGLTNLPYHDNVPSFGEWGWWIAKRPDSGIQLQSSLLNLENMPVPTRYIHSGLVRANMEFGKGWLDDSEIEINTLTSDSVYHYYLEGWQENFL